MPAASFTGSFVAATTYPRVYMTKAKAQAWITSKNPNVVYALKRLTSNVNYAISNLANLSTPYVGTDLVSYEKYFSLGGGAAEQAAQLAMYAYLYDQNLGFGDATIAANARAAALKILTVWATGSFVTSAGTTITSYTQFTDSAINNNQPGAEAAVALQIGRGMVYYVDAADMLNDGNISYANMSPINQFIIRMRTMLIGAANYHYSGTYNSYPRTGCNSYDNQATVVLQALTALGAYTSYPALMTSLAGTNSNSLLDWSLPQQIEGTIYGTNDAPRTCSPLSYSYNDPTSGQLLYFQTTTVAAGEIVDRFRAEPGQTFGYTGGNLVNLEVTSDVMARVGFDMADFQGDHGQSLETALDYYGQYSLQYLSWQPLVLPATGTIADYAQYAGDETDGVAGADVQGKSNVLPQALIGTHIYPNDTTASGVISLAQSIATANNSIAYSATDVVTWSDWFVPAN